MARYFFRVDDVAPNMNWDNFNIIVSLFERYNIKPLLAVIPNNKDSKLLRYPASSDFWRIIKELSQDGWAIAQHGFEHLYKTENGGILGINSKGEFAGLRFETQKEMIFAGKQILKDKIVEPEIFVATAHSFDKNTVSALCENGFKYLSDGIALYPFEKWGITWLPQIFWRPRKSLFGLVTIALHPNTISCEDLENIQKFIQNNQHKIGNFEELMAWHEKGNLFKKRLTFFVNQIFKIIWRAAFFAKHGLSK